MMMISIAMPHKQAESFKNHYSALFYHHKAFQDCDLLSSVSFTHRLIGFQLVYTDIKNTKMEKMTSSQINTH